MEHEMKESLPKSWDKTKRVYEITYPSGKREIWKNITARECLTKYENYFRFFFLPKPNQEQIQDLSMLVVNRYHCKL